VHEIAEIAIADLLLDEQNPRLPEEHSTQQAVYLALARQQGRRLLRLAEDIMKQGGVDPTTLTAVTPTADRRRRYKVVEGNRRVLALKAIETPSIVSAEYSAADQKKWNELSARFGEKPIDRIACVIFDSDESARHWVELRHTGANDGVGVVEWDANEKDRWKARHGSRQPAGQVIDFVDRVGGVEPIGAKILTNVNRLIVSKPVAEALGIQIIKGTVYSHYPAEELAKGLRRMVDDLRSGRVKVKNIYDSGDRLAYMKEFGPRDLPAKSTRLKEPVPLDELNVGKAKPPSRSPKPKPIPKRAAPDRTALIPSSSTVNPTLPRINAIANELGALSVDQYPNACAVLLRVFVELSVDHELEQSKLMTEQERRNARLAAKLKRVAEHLYRHGRINDKVRKMVVKVADSQGVLSAATTTFNQYVHNQYVYPKPTELRTAWDELQPFMEKLWP
jgi:hypothetical protein